MDIKRLIATLLCICGFLTVVVSAQDVPEEKGPPSPSPLVREPETPEELFDATLFMLKLGKVDLARYYLELLVGQDIEEATLLKMREKHGTAAFLELLRVEELNKAATDLSKRLQLATRNHVSDPAYFPLVLQKLSQAGRARQEAIDEIRYIGPKAVPMLLNEIRVPTVTSHSDATQALVQLDRDAVGPLLGALEADDPVIVTAALEVLGHLAGRTEILFMQRFAFADGVDGNIRAAARSALARHDYQDPARTDRLSGYGASRELNLIATKFLKREYQWEENLRDDGLRSIWSWDPAAGTLIESLTTEHLAGIYFAERLARDASLLAPEQREPAITLLAALMTRDIEQAGWNQPVPMGTGTAHDLALAAGADTCIQTLEFGRQHQLVAPQVVSLLALASNGSANLLSSGGGSKSAVISALDAPEPRVQYAAATTILSWRPSKPFAGSRRVVEIIARALNSEDTPTTVVIDPNLLRGSQTSGLFNAVGLRGIQSPTGMEGFAQAVERGDIELAVLHPNTIRWELTDTIANLRNDSRTASLPIVIYGPTSLRNKLNFFTEQYQNVAFIDEALTSNDLIRQLDPFLAQISPPPLTVEQRGRQIKEALKWMQVMANSPDIFDISAAEASLSGAANDPELADTAIQVLATISTPSVQSRLLSLTTAPAVDASTRNIAAQELGRHIQRVGNKLSNTDLEAISMAATSETDPRVQSSLMGVLGALKPTSAASRLLILGFPKSTAPLVPAGN